MTLRELQKLFPNLIVFLNENHFKNEFDDFYLAKYNNFLLFSGLIFELKSPPITEEICQKKEKPLLRLLRLVVKKGLAYL